MNSSAKQKYWRYPVVDLPDRQWPSRILTQAPVWCSVDLRDGNQALAVPMNIEQKLEMFEMLVGVGLKEIEVGFPSASQIEFDFLRRLIDEDLIPDDVRVQVLVQAKEPLIDKTVQSLKGCRQCIIHLYNSTNPAQREIVFGKSKEEILQIAVTGTQWVKERLSLLKGTEVTFQYSPESFSLTEPEFALEVCEAVKEVWSPNPEKPIILNLPATVEVATPNVHADQIEWFCRHLKNRRDTIVSLHTHNDRGTGTAATELGLLAGADRVEGTLFGNGERTGNLDLIIVALNLYSQGIEPGLDFSDLPRLREIYERCTRMQVPDRHPYSGDLVFTAFSGSHQDAINKGFKHYDQKSTQDPKWDVPYLPIDPQDIGRRYDAIIRINSQSGKGGVAHVLERDYGYELPKSMHAEIGQVINQIADSSGAEVSGNQLLETFKSEYVNRTHPFSLGSFVADTEVSAQGGQAAHCRAEVIMQNQTHAIEGYGNGPIDAFYHAIQELLESTPAENCKLVHYSQHSFGTGAKAIAVAYIQIEFQDGKKWFGVGEDTNIGVASIRAFVSALNRTLA
ncbi:MAG: 2-isopropylmalate synthase [Verrucomicrobiota bacterium]